MSYDKEIICLANSRKTAGRCIAGKELVNGEFVQWVRPVSSRDTHEISEEDRRYSDGASAQTLETISIRFKSISQHSFQKENHLIDDQFYWGKTGQLNAADLGTLIDRPKSLWSNNNSSYNGTNDRVSEDTAAGFDQSLYLITLRNLEIIVRVEGAEFNNEKKRVRAAFEYNGVHYLLSVTDPVVERTFLGQGVGTYSINCTTYMTVSLGDVWKGQCYKLIAAIFGI